MRRLKILFLLSAVSVFASDCDFKFTLTTANPTVTVNNKGLACYTWQVTDFVNGFSAVSVQFESAADVNGTPGSFSAFQGSILIGSNPTTATTQNTSIYQGAYPWIRIELVSSSGTGNVTGRMLGAQATSATLVPFGQNPVFGTFTVPVPTDFSFVDQGNTVQTNQADGILLSIPFGGESDNVSKLCATMPAAPWSLTMAFYVQTSLGTNASFAGPALYNAAAPSKITELIRGTYGGSIPTWDQMYSCTGANFATCGSLYGDTLPRLSPVSWIQARDDGSTRFYYESLDGKTWQQMRNFRCAPALGCLYTDTSPIQKGCFTFYSNSAVQGGMSAKLVSWKICSNSTGAAC